MSFLLVCLPSGALAASRVAIMCYHIYHGYGVLYLRKVTFLMRAFLGCGDSLSCPMCRAFVQGHMLSKKCKRKVMTAFSFGYLQDFKFSKVCDGDYGNIGKAVDV
uniref:Putative secreted protein n=1 Tax=Ixodes ricinus TaxID=34613 RepID=A0A6B0UB19_IXORI